MDPRLLTQAAALLYKMVTQVHPEPCSLDTIETAVHDAAHQVARLTAEMWAQAVVDGAETARPRCPCGVPMCSERQAQRTILMLVGLVRLKLRRFRCPACGGWCCPGIQLLQLAPRVRMTQAVQEVLCALGLSWGYQVAARFVGRFLPGVAVSPKSMERVVKRCAAIVAAHEEAQAAQLEAARAAEAEVAFSGADSAAPVPLPSAPSCFANPGRVYLGLDGILVRGRQAKEWLEVQVASFWRSWQWRSGCRPPRREITDATFVARAEGWEALGKQVWWWFVARGGRCSPGREVVVLGDGAAGIRSLREFYFPRALTLLDPWHLWEKVKRRAREVLRDRQRALGAAQVVYQRLKRGALAEARELVAHWPAASEWAAGQRDRLLAFLERNADSIRDYEELRRQGYMVGSGLTEKANELVVAPRMKNGKMHWSREGANAVALLRARVLNAPDAPLLPT